MREYSGKHTGICPLHGDEKPSFFVYSDNRFKCFGCGESGDAVDFIQKLHGISFQDALKYLGIHKYKPTLEEKKKIEVRKERKRTRQAFKEWEKKAADEFGTLVRCAHKALRTIKTRYGMEKYGDLFHSLPYWEHCHNILCTGTDEEKYQLFTSV